jgi:hypothetical protein
VGNRECFHDDISQFKGSARDKTPAIKTDLGLILNRFLRWPITVNWDSQFLPQAGQALHVVRMLVGYENSGQVLGGTANRSEALPDLPQAEPGIDQQSNFVGF